MSLVEKYALLPDEIDRESLKIVEASLPGSLSLSTIERYVVSRIVRAEGDPGVVRPAFKRPELALLDGASVPDRQPFGAPAFLTPRGSPRLAAKCLLPQRPARTYDSRRVA